MNGDAQICGPSSLPAVADPTTRPEPEPVPEPKPEPQPDRFARRHSVSSQASDDYSIDSRSTPSDGASRAASLLGEPIPQFHWCSSELPAQGARFLRGPLPDDVSQLTLYSYQNAGALDGERTAAEAIDKPEKPSLPLACSGGSTPDGNDVANGAPRRDSAERVGAGESRPPAHESDPLCAGVHAGARQPLSPSESHAVPLSEEPYVTIAPLSAAGDAGHANGAAPGERAHSHSPARTRPPLPAHLSLNLLSQWHRSTRKEEESCSVLKGVLSVVYLVGCAASTLLLLYFFYDVFGVYHLCLCLCLCLSNLVFSLCTLLSTAVYIFFGLFIFYAGVALSAIAIKLLDLAAVPQPQFFFYR